MRSLLKNKIIQMKKIYFLLIILCFLNVVNAQIINIPDANFKAILIESNYEKYDIWDINNTPIKVDSNNNGEIEVNEVLAIHRLGIGPSNISDLTGIEYFSNLKVLSIGSNNLTNLDVSRLANLSQLYCDNNSLANLSITGLKNLQILYCNGNKLTDLNLSNLSSLEGLWCYNNKLVSLDISASKNLKQFYCNNNQLKSLDVSFQQGLWELMCSNNNLESLNLKNGTGRQTIYVNDNPNLKYICVNEADINVVRQMLNSQGITNCLLNSYCSFNPGGTFYTMQGNSKLDTNNNGYDSNDDNCSNLNFSISDGTNKGNIISDSSGNYSIPVGEGTHTITPILENPNYFTVSPASSNVTFPTQTSPFIQNFCITPNGIKKDLEVTVLPTIPARPGFDATYKIIYKNKGNQTQSGSVSLSFNDTVLDLVSAISAANIQVTDKLTWDYTNLKPLESREIIVTFNVNSPMETPAVNNGDRLSFNALINPVAGDEKPVDNSFALRQTVVGSYDPNDKTCLEGDIITPDLIGEYVHYLIRFENTGTYPAQNVVIKDLIDLSKFDISTLIPTKASHDFVTKISNNNKVEFIFENIQLPFADATNDGFVAFKIKTLPTLKVGDSFKNEANIYFDYNFPILTNTAKSTFQTLGTQEFQFSDYFSLYPNPVNDFVNIESKSTIEVKSMAVYDILGQIIIAVPDAKTVSKIDVSILETGNYFLKMNTNKGTSNVKFIKK